MRDTAAEVRRAQRARFRALDAETRIRMATGMFAAARELCRAGAKASSPEVEWDRQRQLQRLYGADLDPEVLAEVARRLAPDH